jgi:hypothetical protein
LDLKNYFIKSLEDDPMKFFTNADEIRKLLWEEVYENLINKASKKILRTEFKKLTKNDPLFFFEHWKEIIGSGLIPEDQYEKLMLLAFKNIVKTWNSSNEKMKQGCDFLRSKWVKFSDATPVFSVDKDNNLVIKQDYNSKRMVWYTNTIINLTTFEYEVEKIRHPKKINSEKK